MVTRAKVQNYLVVAIDEKLRDYLVSKGYNVYFKDISVSTAAMVMHMLLSATIWHNLHYFATEQSRSTLAVIAAYGCHCCSSVSLSVLLSLSLSLSLTVSLSLSP